MSDRPQDSADRLPLLGLRVGVTAARRREEQVRLLERRGAQVTCAAPVRTVGLHDDADLRAATRACLADPPDVVVATTGAGFRGWCEAADGWGLGERLAGVLRGCTILARGPKTIGAVRGRGLREAWSAPSETLDEVLDHLLAAGVRGRRVVLQEHGEPLPAVARRLRSAGADVVVVSVYRWESAGEERAVSRLVDMVLRREVHAVTFTSAPAASAFLDSAERAGSRAALLDALREDVTAVCVGPVTAAPLEQHGVPTVQPDRGRLGAMVRALTVALAPRAQAG
jgi:uroporphyrinogen-III synthase